MSSRKDPGPRSSSPSRLRRWRLLRWATGLLLAAMAPALGACSFQLPGLDGGRSAASYKVTAPWQAVASGQVTEFKLVIGRTQWELSPGKVVEAYAYNGRVPGPELRVT